MILVDPQAIQDSTLDAQYDTHQIQIHTILRLSGAVPKAALDLLVRISYPLIRVMAGLT